VLVHDAARPFASRSLYADVIAAVVAGADAVVPAIAVVDTIRSLDGGVVPRDRLVAVQTPQGFRASALRTAHEGSPEATDDATLVEAVGGLVVVVPGAATNLKVTTPVDLVIAEALLGLEERS
jgi:2-C-methyl-D-erythritol 4-phosphate cytidylyltransferase